MEAAGQIPKRKSSAVPLVEPYQDVTWAWNGFWWLSKRRPQSMNGPLNIPMSEIVAYASAYEMHFSRRQDFIFYVDQMDEAFMDHVHELQAEEERKNANKSPAPRRR